MSEQALQPQSVDGTTRFHVAVIMDGNGRWAKARSMPRIAGHRAGAKAVRRCVEAAPDQGVQILTLYAFSSDNWERPAKEVRSLMSLLEDYLEKEAEHCAEKGVRISVIGRRDRLSQPVLQAIVRAERITEHATGLNLRIAVDYSARHAIAAAARLAPADRELDYREFLNLINQVTHSPDAPPVDLLIRTSGEKRLSDFMLWECAYSELSFIDCLWPEFGGDHLADSVREFRQRDRRYGRVAEAG